MDFGGCTTRVADGEPRSGGDMAAQSRMLVPYAHVADVERSIGFYAGLGFRVKTTVVPDGQTAPV